MTIWGKRHHARCAARQLGAAVRVLCQIDLLVRDPARVEQRLRAHAERAGIGGVDGDVGITSQSIARTGRRAADSLKTEAVVLRSMRYGEADRILHLYTPHRGRVSAIAKGVRAHAQPLRRPAGAVLPPAPRAPRGPLRPADRHQRRDGRRARAAARATAPRSTPPRAPATPSARLFETERAASRRSSTCSATSSRCSTPTPARRRRTPTSSRSASSSCSPPGFAPQLAACASCGEREHLVGFSRRRRRRRLRGLRGVGASRSTRRRTRSWPTRSAARWPRRPPPAPRALRQAERAIAETVEHHAHVRLRAGRRRVGSGGR